MCGSAQNNLMVSKFRSESVAFWLNASSARTISLLNLFRHSVNGTVKPMYAAITPAVMTAKYHSYCENKYAHTKPTSKKIGAI